MDGLEVLLAREHERVVLELGQRVDQPAQHLAHAVLDETRPAVRLLDHGELVGALHQLEDLGAHRLLDDAQQRLRAQLGVAPLRAADVEAADAALVVGRDRHGLEHPLDLVVGEALLDEPLARRVGDQLLGARAGGHALRLDADEPPHAALRRDGGADQRVQLLRREPGHGRLLVLGVARPDRDLGAQAALALAHALGDVRRQSLRLQRLADHDRVDGLVHDLLETRHVHSGLERVEVHVALERRVVELLVAVRADPEDLLDARDADAREAHAGRRPARLHVGFSLRKRHFRGRFHRTDEIIDTGLYSAAAEDLRGRCTEADKAGRGACRGLGGQSGGYVLRPDRGAGHGSQRQRG